MTNAERLAKVEQLLKAIGRDAQAVENYELADQIGRTANYALELLSDVRAESDATATDELAIAA